MDGNGLSPTLENLTSVLPPTGHGGRMFGVNSAIVTDVDDPQGIGRVRVRLPWLTDSEGEVYEAWARLATLMAGPNRGTWFVPDPGDEVLVAFEHGQSHLPYVVGMLWNGVDAPPESMVSENPIRSITSRSGIKITFNDTQGGVELVLETPGGQRIVSSDMPPKIEISDSSGNQIRMESSGITINTPARFALSASLIELSAGVVKVDAGMNKFSGIVQSDTNITNCTISASYTPGAGSIW
jgi:uncharacterized protein involved in type VI secretion and phage assembly